MYKAYIVAAFILVRAWREKGTALHGDGDAGQASGTCRDRRAFSQPEKAIDSMPH